MFLSWYGNSAVIAFVLYCSQGKMVNFIFLGLVETFQLLGPTPQLKENSGQVMESVEVLLRWLSAGNLLPLHLSKANNPTILSMEGLYKHFCVPLLFILMAVNKLQQAVDY